jgi:hypothetical protein
MRRRRLLTGAVTYRRIMGARIVAPIFICSEIRAHAQLCPLARVGLLVVRVAVAQVAARVNGTMQRTVSGGVVKIRVRF